jgi:hypothetical protein
VRGLLEVDSSSPPVITIDSSGSSPHNDRSAPGNSGNVPSMLSDNPLIQPIPKLIYLVCALR